jgi:hypothetical protein
MSDDTESRLTKVETRLDQIERDLTKVSVGIDKLLATNASNPQPLSWKAVGATLVSVASAGAVIWGVISMSPAVNELRTNLDRHVSHMDKRITEIDGKWGRLAHIEQEQRRTTDALRWQPTIARTQ